MLRCPSAQQCSQEKEGTCCVEGKCQRQSYQGSSLLHNMYTARQE